MPRKNKSAQIKNSGLGREAFWLFGFALLVRLLGIGWGLPDNRHFFSYHPDEFFVVRPAITMLQGDWNPHFFNYGTFYIYLIGFAAKLLSGLGLSPAASGGLGFLHLIARLITALLGVGTVILVYFIGRQLGGRRLAFVAALLLALTPLHLVNSHYATVDVPGTFFLLLAGAASVQIIASGKLRWYLLAVAAVGLAAATKYPLGAGLLLPFGAHLLRGRVAIKEHLKLITLLAFPVFFLVGCPYALDFAGGLHFRKEFLQGLFYEVRHMGEIRTPAFLGAGNGWSYHALRGFPAGLGIPLYLLSLLGLGLALTGRLARSEPLSRKTYLLFACWSVVFFLIIGRATERFIRYLIPFTPFYALLTAAALQELLRDFSLKRKLLFCVIAAGLLLNLSYAFAQLYLLMKTDPRDEALTALLAHRPTSVGLEALPWFQGPPVSPYNAGWASEKFFEQWRVTAPYQVIITGWEKQKLLAAKPQYFVVSDLQYVDFLRLKEPRVREFMEALANSYQKKSRFGNPTPLDWVGGGKDNAPPDWLYLKPTISLYADWRQTESD